MEPSKFVAFCSFRDEALQCIDDFLTRRQKLENDSEITAAWDRLAVSETPPEGPAPPTGYLQYGKPILWNGVCCGWPESARHAADFLRDVREIGEAKGIYRELSRLPTEVTDWERLHDYYDVTREAALRVKAILIAIRSAASDEPQAAAEKPTGKKPVLTEPLTKKKLGEYFTCHRNNVKEKILDVYPHEPVGNGRGVKYRMHVANMPPTYHQEHAKPKP